MRWSDTLPSKTKGLRHATLSPSVNGWLRYNDDDLLAALRRKRAAARGTRLHAFAAEAIALGEPIAESECSLNMFVNDAIRYNMRPEQLLWYSRHAFGTADAITFLERGKPHLLRVHDLKTGVKEASFVQLEIYAALFFLQYSQIRVDDVEVVLRIYQNDDIREISPPPEVIIDIMDVIRRHSAKIDVWEENHVL